MAKLSGVGAPTNNTKAAIGDIYTDTSTGRKYECIEAHSYSTYHGTKAVYRWDFVEEIDMYLDETQSGGGSGGGGTVSSWKDIPDKPFGGEETIVHDMESENSYFELTEVKPLNDDTLVCFMPQIEFAVGQKWNIYIKNGETGDYSSTQSDVEVTINEFGKPTLNGVITKDGSCIFIDSSWAMNANVGGLDLECVEWIETRTKQLSSELVEKKVPIYTSTDGYVYRTYDRNDMYTSDNTNVASFDDLLDDFFNGEVLYYELDNPVASRVVSYTLNVSGGEAYFYYAKDGFHESFMVKMFG